MALIMNNCSRIRNQVQIIGLMIYGYKFSNIFICETAANFPSGYKFQFKKLQKKYMCIANCIFAFNPKLSS